MFAPHQPQKLGAVRRDPFGGKDGFVLETDQRNTITVQGLTGPGLEILHIHDKTCDLDGHGSVQRVACYGRILYL